MIMYLYTTKDDENVMNKTLKLKHEVEVSIKGQINLTQPTFTLYEDEDLELKEVNYAYLPEFERYYFVRTVNAAPNKIYELYLECDLLETYKASVLNSEAEITRKIEEGDYNEISPELEVIKETSIYESDRGFIQGETSILFSTLGQTIFD